MPTKKERSTRVDEFETNLSVLDAPGESEELATEAEPEPEAAAVPAITKLRPGLAPDSPRSKLIPRDFINEKFWYSPEELERLLSIPASRTNMAFESGEFNQYKKGGAELELNGANILAWIDRRRIQWTVTDSAFAIWCRLHAMPAPRLSPPPPSQFDTLLEQASGKAAALKAEQDENESLDREWNLYFVILCRAEALPSDAQDLAGLMLALKLDAQQVQADRDLIIRARELAAKADDRASAITKAAEARAAYRQLEERHKAEERAADRLRNRATGYQHDCSQAGERLSQLARQRPQFFTTENPPRLRE